LQQGVVKTGGRLLKQTRYYRLLAKSHMARCFGAILEKIAALLSRAGQAGRRGGRIA
jgi:hypothetical protein